MKLAKERPSINTRKLDASSGHVTERWLSLETMRQWVSLPPGTQSGWQLASLQPSLPSSLQHFTGCGSHPLRVTQEKLELFHFSGLACSKTRQSCSSSLLFSSLHTSLMTLMKSALMIFLCSIPAFLKMSTIVNFCWCRRSCSAIRAWGNGAQIRGRLPFFRVWLLGGGEHWKGIRKYPQITVTQNHCASRCRSGWDKAVSRCRLTSRCWGRGTATRDEVQ